MVTKKIAAKKSALRKTFKPAKKRQRRADSEMTTFAMRMTKEMRVALQTMSGGRPAQWLRDKIQRDINRRG
jgi:hypothetical protein